ncbi:hypothetical protein LK542_21465 [Massilia sp. IC2-477]|uniref:hypothetical protein n=1 Tax=Massilia sp. IC2-477 TaxID=2887198 RepID=UPI001D1274D8|nr:hypothetical protein [Massilia sp. IC2-477]MCC2958197.1 hypothetical protein [Massilia sp. IC2-477]
MQRQTACFERAVCTDSARLEALNNGLSLDAPSYGSGTGRESARVVGNRYANPGSSRSLHEACRQIGGLRNDALNKCDREIKASLLNAGQVIQLGFADDKAEPGIDVASVLQNAWLTFFPRPVNANGVRSSKESTSKASPCDAENAAQLALF